MAVLKTFFFSSILLFIHLCVGCKTNSNSKAGFPGTDRYDFANPKIINLPVYLDEISGIVYYPKDTSVFAIVDEDAILYKIPLTHPKDIRKWNFAKPKDYEDVVLKDSSFYILVSNGEIMKLSFKEDILLTDKYKFPESSKKKTNEFESLYLDSGKIIMLCKDCEDDHKNTKSSFVFDEATTTFKTHNVLDISVLAGKTEKKLKDIKPSAAAINPVTNELYILSSVSKDLIIADRSGHIKEIFDLNPKIYKQPEGIAFTPTGDLIISNEVFLEGHATLLMLKNKLK
jgi:uncharacterized protein YjiK